MRKKKTPEIGSPLTARECEVVVKLCADKTVKELHVEMGISRGTFNKHVVAVLRKTGKRTRTGLVTYALCEKIGEF